MATKKTIYRDSKSGKIISPSDAARKNPATWEKERVNTGKKGK